MPDSDTIHALFTTLDETIHARRATIHYTTQKHTRMETGIELNKTLTSQ